MPSALTYPGVYIEEMPSAVRTITGVPTSIAAFVGRAWKGPVDTPVLVNGYADYERAFGGLWRESTMSYAVAQYFSNGGGQAYVVRVATRTGAGQAKAATITLTGGAKLRAASPGSWGMNLKATVDLATKDTSDAKLFNLTVLDDPLTTDDSAKRGGSGATETFRNVSTDANSPRFVTKVLAEQSQLARVDSGLGTNAPGAQTKGADGNSGTDGNAVGTAEVVGTTNKANLTGMYALTKADIFNLLCIPPYTPATADNGVGTTWTDAANFCRDRRAVLIVDAPTDWTLDSGAANYPPKKIGPYHGIADDYAALYFPWVRVPDPLQDNNLADFAPCGVAAGVIARTDTERGVWKAPAGIEASLRGVLDFSINGLPGSMTDDQNGALNPLGINCLRTMPGIGSVVWGARTLEGADSLASQWKYLPVRRLALYIEESLFRGTKWVVFEPNDEPLWAQIRLNVGAFMHGLFRQGAFQGTTQRDAYLVKCDRETTTQDDINRGVVNILVGFAPLKPAEFVVIKIQQLAGQVQA
jgi:phage tail sheath protein FI